MAWSGRIRQGHRCIALVFTVLVVVNIVLNLAPSLPEGLVMGVGVVTLFTLLLLMISGLTLFAQPAALPVRSESPTEGRGARRTWAIIGVENVASSSAWYRSLFGQANSGPAHDDFDQIRDDDGTVLLCLHRWGAHDHPPLADPGRARPGQGLILFFRVEDFDATLGRARALVDELAEEPHGNSHTGVDEFALWDPDGYYVMVSAIGAG